MELPVTAQARELLAALILGAALGLVYDLLRPLRHGRLSTALTDLLFCLVTTLALLAFLLYAGRGRLRIFAIFGILSGAAVWFLTLSRPLRRLASAVGRTVAAPVRFIGRTLKNILKKSEKIVRKQLHLLKKLLK